MSLIQSDKPFPVIETERLVLREPRTDDLEAILALHQDPDVMRYMGMSPYKTLEQAQQELNWFAGLFNLDRGLRWMITLRGEDTYVGDIGFHNVNQAHRRAEIGYKLGAAYWRKGLMSEAIRPVLAYGFGELGYNRVEAVVDPPNQGSRGVLEKAGFKLEGLLREYEIVDGEACDLCMLSLLKREWQEIV